MKRKWFNAYPSIHTYTSIVHIALNTQTIIIYVIIMCRKILMELGLYVCSTNYYKHAHRTTHNRILVHSQFDVSVKSMCLTVDSKALPQSLADNE